MEKDYVTAETLVLVKDLLRKYPQWSNDCIAVVGNMSSKNVQEPKAKSALLWMLGEYSQDMSDAPYFLESLVENWDDEHAAEVRLHLLTAVMKCFFKRPPETQKALGTALVAGLADSHQDVHDRALFYYRLLQYDISVAERVVNPPKQTVSVFTDTQSSEIKDRIFDEFNSLSVVYQKPSYMFIDKEHRGPLEFTEEIGDLSVRAHAEDNVIPAQRYESSNNDLLLSTSEKEESRVPIIDGSSYSAPNYNSSVSLISPQPQIEGVNPPPSLKLNPKAVLDPGTFLKKWNQLRSSLTLEYSISPQGVAALATPQSLIKHMQSHSIECVTSGGKPPHFEFFFYAQRADGPSIFFLAECNINSSSAETHSKIKGDNASEVYDFSTYFLRALSKLGPP